MAWSLQTLPSALMPSVLHVLATAGRRGAEVFAGSLADALAALGWDNETVAVRAGTGELGVPVVGMRTLARRAKAADVVLAHGSASLPASAVARVFGGAPFVYRSIGDPSVWASTPLRRLRVGLALRRAAGVVALWPEAADFMASTYGLRRGFVTSIPNAVDVERFPPITVGERSAARERWGVAGDAPVVAVIGALSGEKDVETALRGTALVAGAIVLVAGSGPEREALESTARAVGVDARFLGNIDDPGTVLAAADLLVLTSRTEGMPGAVMEAGARGVPVVATDVGGVRTVIDPPTGGVVVPAGDAGAVGRAVRSLLDERRPVGRRWLPATYSMSAVASEWDAALKRARSSEL